MPTDLTRQTVRTDDGAVLRAWVHEPSGLAPDAPAVVLAHGWTLGHESWHRVVDLLAGRARIVLWDQRGHRGSTFAGGGARPSDESIKRLGEDARQVVAATVPAEAPLVLAGHSMGGMTAMAYAGTADAAEIARLRGVVFVATAAGELTGLGLPGEVHLMKLLTRLSPRAHLGRLVRERGQERMLFGSAPRAEDVRLTARLTGSTPLPTYGAFYSALMAHDEVVSLARLADVPVDIFVGTADRLTPRRLAERLAHELPEAQLHVVPDTGHMVLLEAPEPIAEAIAAHL